MLTSSLSESVKSWTHIFQTPGIPDRTPGIPGSDKNRLPRCIIIRNLGVLKHFFRVFVGEIEKPIFFCADLLTIAMTPL